MDKIIRVIINPIDLEFTRIIYAPKIKKIWKSQIKINE